METTLRSARSTWPLEMATSTLSSGSMSTGLKDARRLPWAMPRGTGTSRSSSGCTCTGPRACTKLAIDLAVPNGHARVVQLLLSNRSEGCSNGATSDAIEHLHDAELIHLLFEHRRELIDTPRVRARAEGKESMLRWLEQVGDPTEVEETKRSRGDGWDVLRSLRIARLLWLLDVNTYCVACKCRVARLFVCKRVRCSHL